MTNNSSVFGSSVPSTTSLPGAALSTWLTVAMDGHLNINLNSCKLNKFRNTAPVWNFLPLVCLSPSTFNYPGIHLELHSQYFQNPVNFHRFQNYQCGTHHHSLLPGLLQQTPKPNKHVSTTWPLHFLLAFQGLSYHSPLHSLLQVLFPHVL